MTSGVPEGAWLSTTSRWSCPEGKVYVTIAREAEGRLRRVWVAVGKAGTPLYAAGDALASIVFLALENGIPLDVVAQRLRGISHVDYNGQVHEAASIADALGKALESEK